MIYLDNAATTFPKPDSVIHGVIDYMTNCGASPGRGGYSSAIRSSEILIECQNAIGDLLSVSNPERIVFTKNATEALNTAIFGLLAPGDEVIISSMEHNAVMRAAHECEKRGSRLRIARGEPSGKVLPSTIENLITAKTKLICVIHASNVTGTINDIYEIQSIAKKHNCYALFDCSQSVGVIPVNASGLDMVAFPGHKGLFGPTGTGCLYVRDGINISPLTYGGTGSFSESATMPEIFPDKFHAGTVNIAGIAGLLEGVRFVSSEGVFEKDREITQYLYDSLSQISGVIIPGDTHRSGVVSIKCPNFDPVVLGEKLSGSDICTRAGLHCAPMAHRTIGTVSTGTLRFSPGFFTEKDDVDIAVEALKKIIGK